MRFPTIVFARVVGLTAVSTAHAADAAGDAYLTGYARAVLEREFHVSFGESFALYRDKLGAGWWDAGMQAAVFAFFDLDAPSMDLINADYMVAATVAYTGRRRVPGLARRPHPAVCSSSISAATRPTASSTRKRSTTSASAFTSTSRGDASCASALRRPCASP